MILGTKWNLSLLPGSVPLLDKSSQVYYFFSVPFLHLTLVKVVNITTDLAVSGETIKDKQTILNKTSFGLGILHIPTLQETINYTINIASLAAHGAQGAKTTLLKPLVEILLPMGS